MEWMLFLKYFWSFDADFEAEKLTNDFHCVKRKSEGIDKILRD